MNDDIDICPVCEKVMKKRQCVPCKITFEPLHKMLHKEKKRPRDKGLLAILLKPRVKKIPSISACQVCWCRTRTIKDRNELKVKNYRSLHKTIRRLKPQPDKCTGCSIENKNLYLANISQKYSRDLSGWEYLCRRCHMKKDKRMDKFISSEGHKGRKIIQMDMNNNFIKEYPSAKEASCHVPVHKSNLVRCANGETKSSAGFKWKYVSPRKLSSPYGSGGWCSKCGSRKVYK